MALETRLNITSPATKRGNLCEETGCPLIPGCASVQTHLLQCLRVRGFCVWSPLAFQIKNLSTFCVSLREAGHHRKTPAEIFSSSTGAEDKATLVVLDCSAIVFPILNSEALCHCRSKHERLVGGTKNRKESLLSSVSPQTLSTQSLGQEAPQFNRRRCHWGGKWNYHRLSRPAGGCPFRVDFVSGVKEGKQWYQEWFTTEQQNILYTPTLRRPLNPPPTPRPIILWEESVTSRSRH